MSARKQPTKKVVRATRTQRAKKPSFFTELQRALVSISMLYPRDPTKPGVVLSEVSPGKYYASVVRYEGSMGREKTVVASAYGETIELALKQVLRDFLGRLSAAIGGQDA